MSCLRKQINEYGLFGFMEKWEWKRKKHGAEYRRQWHKVHLAIDADTFEIRAVEVTDNSIGDAPMLPQLLSQIHPTTKKSPPVEGAAQRR